MPVLVFFAMVWQTDREQREFAELERDGVRYLQALVPLEIALTSQQSAVVGGNPRPGDGLARAVDAVAAIDNELGARLRTQERWAGLRTKIESLPTGGTGESLIAAYGGANDLLLALIDKVRNNSKLIRDPDADSYYLSDGSAQELPEGIVAAAQYTDRLITTAKLSQAERAKTLVDISSARSDLISTARDLSEDVRLAVEGTGSRSLGSALLSKLDRFNRSIDALVPLMSPVVAGNGGTVDVAQVVRARAEMQTAAADLSAAMLVQIDIALRDRLSSLDQRRLLAAGTLALSVLLALAPFGLGLTGRRSRPPSPPPAPAPRPTPAHQVPKPKETVPAQWPAGPASPDRSDPEFARWERFGASQ